MNTLKAEVSYAVLRVLIRSGEVIQKVVDIRNDTTTNEDEKDTDLSNPEEFIRLLSECFPRERYIWNPKKYGGSCKWFREPVEVDEEQVLYFSDVVANKLFINLVRQNKLIDDSATLHALKHMDEYNSKSFFKDHHVDVNRFCDALEMLFAKQFKDVIDNIKNYCQGELLRLMKDMVW